jgi:hypothetical protein
MANTTVNSGVSSVSLLAANPTRKCAVIRNTDANALYVLLGLGAASSTNLHYTLNSGDVLEVPAGHLGDIQGIWAADGSGQAVIFEGN